MVLNVLPRMGLIPNKENFSLDHFTRNKKPFFVPVHILLSFPGFQMLFKSMEVRTGFSSEYYQKLFNSLSTYSVESELQIQNTFLCLHV